PGGEHIAERSAVTAVGQDRERNRDTSHRRPGHRHRITRVEPAEIALCQQIPGCRQSARAPRLTSRFTATAIPFRLFQEHVIYRASNIPEPAMGKLFTAVDAAVNARRDGVKLDVQEGVRMTLSSLLATAGPGPAPVEYAVAVDRYLDSATLGAASRRVYRISLTGWAWPLVDRDRPAGAGRRPGPPPPRPPGPPHPPGTAAPPAPA